MEREEASVMDYGTNNVEDEDGDNQDQETYLSCGELITGRQPK